MQLYALLLAASAVTQAAAVDAIKTHESQQRPLRGAGAGAGARNSLATPVEEIPRLGFGTWNLDSEGHNASQAVAHAINVGYRHIDCAAAYGNQPDVGRGIAAGLKSANIARDEVWVTSKLWNDRHGGARQVKAGITKTLHDLGLDYLDLYLMHWPVADEDGHKSIEYLETWKAMEELVDAGYVRHIGVCNFSPAQLRSLLAHSSTKPYAHQMELHPYLPQSAWLQYHRQQAIHVTAYSPLGNMNPTYGSSSFSSSPPSSSVAASSRSKTPIKLLDHPTIQEVAGRRDCTPAQVVLSWGQSRDTSVIPKSRHTDRIEENAQPCALEYEDIRAIQRIGMANLTRFNNPSTGWGVDLYQGLQDA